MTPRSDDLHRELGGMANELKNLSESMHAMRAAQTDADKRAEERETRAAEGRRRLHDRVEETNDRLGGQLSRVQADVAAVKRDLDEVRDMARDAKAVADKVNAWEQRGKGIMVALGVGGTVFGAALTSWFDAIASYVRSKFGF